MGRNSVHPYVRTSARTSFCWSTRPLFKGSEGQLEGFEGLPEQSEGLPKGSEGLTERSEGLGDRLLMYGQTDGQTEFLPILQDFDPYWGRRLKTPNCSI